MLPIIPDRTELEANKQFQPTSHAPLRGSCAAAELRRYVS